MAILVSNLQEMPADEALLERIASRLLRAEGIPDDAELSVALVSEDEIAELNARYLGREGPTDVLAFPLEEPGGEEGEGEEAGGEGVAHVPTLLGDVIIAPRVAERQARELGHSYERELGILLIHGILHLLGYTHDEDADAKLMRAKESALLKLFLE